MTEEQIAQLAAFVRWRFTDLHPWPVVEETVATIVAEDQGL